MVGQSSSEEAANLETLQGANGEEADVADMYVAGTEVQPYQLRQGPDQSSNGHVCDGRAASQAELCETAELCELTRRSVRKAVTVGHFQTVQPLKACQCLAARPPHLPHPFKCVMQS
jgi:hypothetical protein